MVSEVVITRPLAYWIVTFGCVLALVTAFAPQLNGGWHLLAAWLVCGLIPYIVYGSLTAVLDGCTLLTAGAVLLGADLVARLVFRLTAAAQAALVTPVWLCMLLVLVVLPAGILFGKLLGHLPLCRSGNPPLSPRAPGA